MSVHVLGSYEINLKINAHYQSSKGTAGEIVLGNNHH